MNAPLRASCLVTKHLCKELLGSMRRSVHQGVVRYGIRRHPLPLHELQEADSNCPAPATHAAHGGIEAEDVTRELFLWNDFEQRQRMLPTLCPGTCRNGRVHGCQVRVGGNAQEVQALSPLLLPRTCAHHCVHDNGSHAQMRGFRHF